MVSKDEGIGYVSRSTNIISKIDDEPTDDVMQSFFIQAYNEHGIVKAIVDSLVDQVVQDFYFDGKEKDVKLLEKKRRLLDLDTHLVTECKAGLKHGDSYTEVVGDFKKLKVLPPEQMTIIQTPKGKITAYVQETGTKNLVWGTIDDNYRQVFKKDGQVVGKLDNIIHYSHNRQAGDKYGTSIIRAAIRFINIKNYILKNIPTLIQRYLAPIIHVRVGSDEMPVNDESVIEEIRSYMKDIYADTEYVTNHTISMDVKSFKDTGYVDIVNFMKMLDVEIMRAMGVQPVAVPGVEGEGKDSEVQLRFEGRRVKAIQREMKKTFENNFVAKLKLDEETEIVWDYADERELVEHINNVKMMWETGLITRQKANDLLPRKFHEKLPQDKAKDLKDESEDPRVMGVDNPTDPTKSTDMVDGQRVNKDDHRNPLDKKIVKTEKSEREVQRK